MIVRGFEVAKRLGLRLSFLPLLDVTALQISIGVESGRKDCRTPRRFATSNAPLMLQYLIAGRRTAELAANEQAAEKTSAHCDQAPSIGMAPHFLVGLLARVGQGNPVAKFDEGLAHFLFGAQDGSFDLVGCSLVFGFLRLWFFKSFCFGPFKHLN